MTHSFLNVSLFILLMLFVRCENDAQQPERVYRYNGVMTIDERQRTFLLNLPPGYYDDDATALPLVIGLHGTGGKAVQFERDYGLTEKANNSGFVVVYPEGVQGTGLLGIRTWNAGNCCDYAMENRVDDVKFIRDLIDELTASYKIDPRRVYVAGMSNGGMMAYRLACEMPEKIAAIAAVSCSMMAKVCEPSRAIPVLHMHSILDSKVPYHGGTGIGGYYFPPVDSVLNVWAAKNLCTSGGEVVTDNASFRHTRWSSCEKDVMMEYYLTRDGGHAWPGGHRAASWGDAPSTVIDATDLLWDFFQRFRLPE